MDKYEIISIILCLLIIIIVLIIFLSINKKDKEIIVIPLNNNNSSIPNFNNFRPQNNNYIARPVQQTKFELGSVCNNDLQCSSANCSLGYCQTKGYTTGQVGSYCANDVSCDARLNCLNQTCVIHNTTDNWGQSCLNDSDCNSTTICLPLNNNNKVCQFPVGGSCLNSICPAGFECSNGQCLGLAGSVCAIDSNCLGSCDSKAILRLNLNRNKIVWENFITVPANISFTRIKTIENRGLWGLDPNNGIYYTSFKNPTWIKLYDSTLKIKNEMYSIIDMSVATEKLMFLVYKSINDSRYKLYIADNKSLKFYGNLYVKQKNINYKSIKCTKDSDCSSDYSSDSNDSYSNSSSSDSYSNSSNSESDSSDNNSKSSFKLINKILGIDTIIDDDEQIQILIYGSDQKINYYVFSAVYRQQRFNYVGPYQNKLDSQSVVRFFLNNKNQSHSYNYIWDNKISTNGDFISPAVPTNLTPAKILDYDSQGRNLYFIATNNNNTNLYSKITDTSQALLIPGLLNSEARLSTTANNIYIFSKICS